MNTNNNQNGRPPFVPIQTAPPTDPRIRSTADQQDETCKDFVWGICTKGSRCKYRHVLNPEAMKNILKFCHDYQNRSGCTRQGCTYLHTTNEEQTLFLTSGVIPKVLRDRYAAANMYFKDINIINQPPPPPPPLPPASVIQGPSQAVALPSLLAPPPPPPPPTATVTTPTTTILTAHNSMSTSGAAYTVALEPVAIPKFDASKPPPPLPTRINGALKRPEPTEAGPSKRRRHEHIDQSVCESCIRRDIRTEVFRKEIDRLEREKDCQTYLLNTKSEIFANGKLLLKSAVHPEIYQILDEFIEQSSPLDQVDVMNQFQVNSFVSGHSSSLQSQIILNMIDYARTVVGPRNINTSDLTIQALVGLVKNGSQKQMSSVNGLMNGSSTSAAAQYSSSPLNLINQSLPAQSTSRPQNVVDAQKRTFTPKRIHTQAVQGAVQHHNGHQQNGVHQNISYPPITQSSLNQSMMSAVQYRPPPPPRTQAVPPHTYLPYQTAPPPPRPYHNYTATPTTPSVSYNSQVRGVNPTSMSSPRPSTSTATHQYNYLPRYPHTYPHQPYQ